MAGPPSTRRTIDRAGRQLQVELTGPEDGPAVIFHTGTPSSGAPFVGWSRAGAERGVRHIFYSRPGYSASTRDKGRSVASCAADVEAIVDAFKVERFYNVGWSGGGPHALACAALLGERVIATASIAGVAPFDATGLAWLDGQGNDNVEEHGAAQRGEQALREFIEPQADGFAEATGADIQETFGDLLSQVDHAAATGEFADYLATSGAAAVEHGVWGWLDDDLAFMRDWGFDLASITGPTFIWQGRHDRMVPFAHGQWLAEHVPGAHAHLLQDDGHITLVTERYPAILDELLTTRA
jgi:pimeloyl-ACP methyl ester carboxylesterase